MCGIVAACLKEGPVVPVLLGGLRRLEYRGYDSAGLAVAAPGLPLRRCRGRVADLAALVAGTPLPAARTGIAHTRWATHGEPAERNAHPHRQGRVVLVHNGILENHAALREDFTGLGYRFGSETDTEVWAALVAAEMDGRSPTREEVAAAVARAAARAQGSHAIALLHEDLPECIFFARRESPLVVGFGDDGTYLASDVPALLDRTRRVAFLEEGDVGWIDASGARILGPDLEVRERPVEVVSWDAGEVDKGPYEHYMLKEIEEQAAVLGRTLQAATDGGLLPGFALSDQRLSSIERVVMVACGTALHAARVGKFFIEEAARTPVEVDFASEFRYRDPILGPRDLVLAVSQSGETADTLGALKTAIGKGAVPAAVCNVPGSSLHRLAEAVILTDCGPEIGVASTKAFTGQLLALQLFALRLARAKNILSGEAIRRRVDTLRLLRPAFERTLGGVFRDHVKEIAEKYADKPIFFFLGRGKDYPIALEGALKLKEISYVHAEGYPAGEMKHGPLALVSEEMVVVALAGQSGHYAKILGNLQEVRSRGGSLVVVTTTDRREAIELADEAILVPRTEPATAPFLHVVPLQYLAYYIARARGCDIDKPRNLAKSVTVE